MKDLPKPLCIGCNKPPEQLEEYVTLSQEEGLSPDEYVRREEGTYNRENGHFLCTLCYFKAGCPTAPGSGWKAP